MKLIQVSDIHFGTEDRDALAAASELIASEPHDGLVVCGDLTQRGKTNEFEAACEWLEQFDTPQIVVAGNHDTPMLNLPARVQSPFERFEAHFGTHDDVLGLKGRTIAGLNTARGWQARINWAEGVVNLDDLDRRLETSPAPDILVCHHPFQSPPDARLKTDTRRGMRGSARLAAHSLRLLLCGHVHTPTARVWTHDGGNYLAITAGTLSTRLRATPPSLNIVSWKDQVISAEAVTLQAGETQRRTLGQWDSETLTPLDL